MVTIFSTSSQSLQISLKLFSTAGVPNNGSFGYIRLHICDVRINHGYCLCSAMTKRPREDKLTELYTWDTGAAEGIRIVPRIKYEHIALTSFSDMRIDPAVQVSGRLLTLNEGLHVIFHHYRY